MEGTTEAPSATAPLGLGSRALGILLSPRSTFEHLRTHPTWLGMLAALVGVVALSFLVIGGTDVGRQAALDQAVSRIEAFGFQVDDTLYTRLETLAPSYGYLAAAMTIVGGPLALVALSALVFAIFGRAGDDRPTFRHVMAMVTHAGVILAMQRAIAVPVTLFTESLSTPTNVAALLPMLEESGFPARFLGSIDLFTLWWLFVLAVGVSVLLPSPGGASCRLVLCRLRGAGRPRGVGHRAAGGILIVSRRKLWIGLILLLVVAAGIGGRWWLTRSKIVSVTVEAIARRDLEALVSASGRFSRSAR